MRVQWLCLLLLLCLCCCGAPVSVAFPLAGPCDASFNSLAQLQAAGFIDAGFQPFNLSVLPSSNSSSGVLSNSSLPAPINSTSGGNSSSSTNSSSPNTPSNSTLPSSANATAFSYADYGNYTLLLSAANASSIAAYQSVTNWLLYVTSAQYGPGSLSLNSSSTAWQTLSAANAQCTNVGVVDDNTASTFNYSLPLSVQWLAPSHLSGNVTVYALVWMDAGQYYFQVQPLTLPPAIPAPLVSAPQSYVSCNASTDGLGGMTFVCWFAGNDGGSFVSYIAVYAYADADSGTPVDGVRQATSPTTSYPMYATFAFQLSVGQSYVFHMYAGNSAGAGPVNVTTLSVTQQAQSTQLPVTASSTSISAGGVFGIVVGCLAAVALIFLAARFYTRKGHLRQHMQHIHDTDAADGHEGAEGEEEEADEEEVELEEEGEDEDEEGAEAVDEDDVELGGAQLQQKQRR